MIQDAVRNGNLSLPGLKESWAMDLSKQAMNWMPFHLWKCVRPLSLLQGSRRKWSLVDLQRPLATLQPQKSVWDDFCVELTQNPRNTPSVHAQLSGPVALKQGDCDPQGTFGNVWRHRGLSQLTGGERLAVWCMEHVDAAKPPLRHRAAPNNKALSSTISQQGQEAA